MRPVFLALTFGLAVLATGCVSLDLPGTADAPAVVSDTTTADSLATRGGLNVDGLSLLGVWKAIEVIGDGEATRALQSGRTEQQLFVSPGGRATLLVRADGDVTSYNGRIEGNRASFEGIREPFIVIVAAPSFSLRDPEGVRTVYSRVN